MSPVEETYLDMAKSFEIQGNYEKALVWYRKIQDNADVYETIGEYLYRGRGCGKDKQEAKKFFKKAAEYQCIDAMCNLALCEDDLDSKLLWYKRAAEKGNAYGMNMVGIILEDKGTDNTDECTLWFKKAADAGSEIGCYNYAMNVDDAATRIKYLEAAVEKEYIVAMEKYADYLARGIFCEKDVSKAEQLKKKIRQLKAKIEEL